MRAPATPGTMAVPAAPDTADSTSSTQPSPHDPRGRCDEMRVRGIRTTGTTAHKPNGRQWAGDYVRRPLSLLCVMVTMLLLLLLGSLPSATAGTSPSPSSSNKGWESRFKSKTTKRTLFKSRPKSTRLGSGTDSSGGGGGLENSSASAGAGDGGSDSGSGSGTHVRHAFRGVHWSLRAPRIVATTATTSSSSSSSSTLFRHPVGSRWTHLSTFHVPLSSDFTSPVPTRAHARAQEEGIGNEDSEGSEDYAATLSTLFANMPRALHGQALSSRLPLKDSRQGGGKPFTYTASFSRCGTSASTRTSSGSGGGDGVCGNLRVTTTAARLGFDSVDFLVSTGTGTSNSRSGTSRRAVLEMAMSGTGASAGASADGTCADTALLAVRVVLVDAGPNSSSGGSISSSSSSSRRSKINKHHAPTQLTLAIQYREDCGLDRSVLLKLLAVVQHVLQGQIRSAVALTAARRAMQRTHAAHSESADRARKARRVDKALHPQKYRAPRPGSGNVGSRAGGGTGGGRYTPSAEAQARRAPPKPRGGG